MELSEFGSIAVLEVLLLIGGLITIAIFAKLLGIRIIIFTYRILIDAYELIFEPIILLLWMKPYLRMKLKFKMKKGSKTIESNNVTWVDFNQKIKENDLEEFEDDEILKLFAPPFKILLIILTSITLIIILSMIKSGTIVKIVNVELSDVVYFFLRILPAILIIVSIALLILRIIISLITMLLEKLFAK